MPDYGKSSSESLTMRLGLKRVSRAVVLALGFSLFPITPITLIPANALPTEITFETTAADKVVLGALATRSRNGQLNKSGSTSPYTMTGTDSATATTYQYTTDANYGVSHSYCSGCAAQVRESDERTPSNAGAKLSTYTRTVSTVDGRANTVQLFSQGQITYYPTIGGTGTVSNKTLAGNDSFGSTFGPQVWSRPFVANDSQAVSFEWKAQGGSDDYEVYGFLVRIDAQANCTSSSDYGSNSTHTVLTHGRGLTRAWTTTTGNIGTNGCYRFRMVGGTYDASGGLAVGASFYIANATLGDAQVITFTQPSDVTGSTSQTVNISVSSNAGDTATAAITLTSTDTNVCTLSSPTSRTVTVLANQAGNICSIRADSAASGSYGAATSITRSFSIRASATKPVTTGGDLVSGNPLVCSTLSVTEGSWTDGGAAISGTSYQWKKDGSAIIGSTSSTYVVQASDAGSTISFSITKTNSVGSTTANSNSVIILDARMSSLGLSAGVLSPTFNGCTFSYSASVSTNSITVTPTLESGAATVTVAGSSVVSGQRSGSISLTAGSNAISIVVTNGTQTSTTTLTVTYAQAPTVNLLAPTSVTGTGATLNATINANGQNTSNIYLEISTSATFASDTSTVTATPSTASGTSNTSISAAVTGLVFQTTYYVRAFATNATGTMTSITYSFTTPAAPFVTTSAASDTSTTGVTLNGSVVGNGDSGGTSTTVVFQYSLNSDMSSPIEVSPASNGTIAGGDTTTIAVSKALTGLEAGNTYYFRLKATNNYGTNVGSTLSITLKGAPTVTSAAPTSANIGTTTAKLSGTVDANSDVTTAISIRWGTSSGSLGNTLAVTPTSVSGNSSTSVEANMTGLTHSTTYYFKLRATNSTGTTDSTEYSFTTNADAVPTATLSAPGNTLLSQPFTVTITFSEVVTGFASGDLSLSGASTNWTAQLAQEVAASSRIFTVEFVPGTGASIPTAGNFTIGLASNKVTDSAGQNNTAATSVTVITSSGLLAPDITYPSSGVVSGNVNSALTTVIPTNTGGVISSWSIASPPSLPGGITFSTTTGRFSGTPTETLSSTAFVVTATNATGSDTATVTMTIGAALIPIISYSPSTISATVGTAISTLTPTNSGYAATSWSINSPLPSGLSFNTSTGVISGTSTATSSSSVYTVTATNSSGSATTTITVSSSAIAVVVVNTVPNAPTIGTATATGSTTATVTYTAPASDGGATITSYTATSSPGSITGSLSQAGSGTISVTGLSAGTTYTFTVVATNSVGNSSPSAASNSITTTSASTSGLIPTFSAVTTASTGFTVTVTNYSSSYTWSVTVTTPATVNLSSSGLITVTGLSGQGTPATVTVTTSRTGYTSQSASVSGTTNPPPPPPNYLYTLTAPTLSKVSTTYVCLTGTYEFVRAAVTKEIPNISFFIYTLIVNGDRVSQISTNGVTNSPYVGSSTMSYQATASKTQAIFELGARTDILPAQCEVLAYQENAVGMGNSNILAKAIPNVSWPSLLPITAATRIGASQLNATADVEGSFDYSIKGGSTLEVGKYTLTVTFTPKDIDNYSVVTVKNQLRVVSASTSIRNAITIKPPQETIQVRLSSGSLVADPEMILGGNALAGAPGYGIEKISIAGSSVTVWPVKGFSGKTSLGLVQSGAGGVINIVQPLIVLPSQVTGLTVQITNFASPTVNWNAVAGAQSYRITAGNQLVCVATTNTCASNIPLGPKSALTITATGNDQVKIVSTITPMIKADVEAASVNFDSGEFVLTADARTELLRFARAIRPLGYTKLTVTGHTDTDQGVDNNKLSQDRAKAVLALLQELLPGVSISIKGQADSEPVASNNNEAGKAKNRRVEIRVVQLQP
jgi:outer membrane protein OmpA-like peptidoglycan-associated protein